MLCLILCNSLFYLPGCQACLSRPLSSDRVEWFVGRHLFNQFVQILLLTVHVFGTHMLAVGWVWMTAGSSSLTQLQGLISLSQARWGCLNQPSSTHTPTLVFEELCLTTLNLFSGKCGCIQHDTFTFLRNFYITINDFIALPRILARSTQTSATKGSRALPTV